MVNYILPLPLPIAHLFFGHQTGLDILLKTCESILTTLYLYLLYFSPLMVNDRNSCHLNKLMCLCNFVLLYYKQLESWWNRRYLKFLLIIFHRSCSLLHKSGVYRIRFRCPATYIGEEVVLLKLVSTLCQIIPLTIWFCGPFSPHHYMFLPPSSYP